LGRHGRRKLLLAGLGLSAVAVTAPLTALTDLARGSEPRNLADWHVAVADHLHALRTRPPAQARDDLALDLRSRSMWSTDIKGTRAKALALLGRHQEAEAAIGALQSAAPAGTPDCQRQPARRAVHRRPGWH
jgi:hypothetical protein